MSRPVPPTDPLSRGPAWGWPVALLLAALAATGAVVLLEPSAGELIDPEPLRLQAVLPEGVIDRNRAFARPQLAIGLLALAAQLAVLTWLAVRTPARMRALGPSFGNAAATGAILSVVLTVTGLPFAALARERARRVGLSTQDWLGWAWDLVLSAAIAAGLAALGAAVALALIRRLPRTWWIPGSVIVTGLAAVTVFASPLVLDPLFNRFESLPSGRLRSDVTALAEAAGVRVGAIEVMDASRRTTGANAYVAGLGASKRIVIYDNVVRDFTPGQARAIVAHELGHQRYGDLGRGILYVALVAPFGLLAVAVLTRRLERERAGHPATLPALALALLLVSTGTQWISNALSRDVERRADAWSLRATGDPQAFAGLQRRLVVRNRSDPAPPALVRAVLSTHPSALERFGTAAAFRGSQPLITGREARP